MVVHRTSPIYVPYGQHNPWPLQPGRGCEVPMPLLSIFCLHPLWISSNLMLAWWVEFVPLWKLEQWHQQHKLRWHHIAPMDPFNSQHLCRLQPQALPI